MSRLRHPIAPVAEAPAAQTMRIRTRIPVSEEDRAVVIALGEHFGHLAGADLVSRCRAGSAHGKHVWAARKQALTGQCSSRWAGSVTKSSNAAYATARRNQQRQLADLGKAISVIEAKRKLPVRSQAERKALLKAEAERAKTQGRKPRRLAFGYRSAHEHAMKRQRLQALRARKARLEADIQAGRVHICRGGKALLGKRLHLEAAEMTPARWRAQWQAKRAQVTANGEAGKTFGNETIRVHPDGTVEIDLPAELGHLANVTSRALTRYRFDAKARFSYRRDAWLAQVGAHRAVAYTIFAEPGRGRVYLDASFTPAERGTVSALDELLASPAARVLAVDLNHGFLAPAVVDRAGNPLRLPGHLPVVTEDLPAAVRDGHLRQAITTLLDLAEIDGCQVIVAENLGFGEMRATGRERYGSAAWFRKTVCSMPARQFRDRLVAMAARRAIRVAGVPAAYSSTWGRAYWQEACSSTGHKISGHTAAAVVLGRRALGLTARRRAQASPGVTAPDQRIEAAGRPAGVESYHVPDPELPRASTREPRDPAEASGHCQEAAKPRPNAGKTRNGDGGNAPAPCRRRPFAPTRSDVTQLALINADCRGTVRRSA